MADNQSTLIDGFGEDPDWIEIHNPTDQPIDLLGYHLTDQPSSPSKWEFTASTVLQPLDYLVVFASSRNTTDPQGNWHTDFTLDADGDYIALTAPDLTVVSEFDALGTDYSPQVTDVSYGLPGSVLVNGQSAAHYLVPSSDALGESWTSIAFDADAAGFSLGRAAIGYENSGGSSTSYLDVFETEVPSGTTNTYVRMPFDIPDASQVSDLQLHLKFDDGVVVYLNGSRLFGVNDPTPLSYNTPATQNHPDGTALAGIDYDLTAHVGLLQSGENVLAIHALNRPNSSDFLMVPTLSSNSVHSEAGYLLTPTPGSINGVARELGPMVTDVDHQPGVAIAGQTILVTAEIESFAAPVDPTTVRLHYRIMYGAESTLTMFDDGVGGDAVAGDGTFSALIPGASLQAGELVRWYVTVSDTQGIETRAPRFLDPLDSAEYFGTVVADPAITTDLPLIQWFIANPEAAKTTAGSSASLFIDGELYDNIHVDNHGQSTRGSAFPKKSYDFDANSGQKFKLRSDLARVSDFNLLTNYADQTKLRNTLTYDLFAQGDYAHHFAFPVMIYQNGSFNGLYDIVEEGDTEYLDRLGVDDENALYKVNNRLDHVFNNVEKKSRKFEDRTDFAAVVDAAQNLTDGAALDWDYDNLDIADMVNIQAIHSVVASNDFGHKNMYWYRDSTGTALWSVYPWDQDLSLGHQWDRNVSPPYFKDDLVTQANIYRGGNPIFQRLFADATFVEMFHRRVRTLTDEFYGAPGTSTSESYLAQKIVSLEASIADEAIQNTAVWGIHPNFSHTPAQAAQQLLDEFIPQRRAYLNNHNNVPGSQIAAPNVFFDHVDYDAEPISGLQAEEYVRLNNPNGFAVDISGWRIDGGIDHTFKGGTVIPAGGTLYVVKDVVAFQNRATGPGAGQRLLIQGNYKGQLGYTGEVVNLIDPGGRIADTLFTPSGTPTPNQQYLRVSEVQYNPSATDAEFIELMNVSSGANATTLDLSGVSITDGPSVPFVFPAQTFMPSGERWVIVQDTAAFRLAHPDVPLARIAGQYVGKLSNSGERIKVVDSGGETIVDFTYSDGDPWPIAADGSGASLELIDEAGTPTNRMDKPYSWRASTTVGGSPGDAQSPVASVLITEILSHTDAPQVDTIELHNPTALPVDIGGWFLSDSQNNLLKFQVPIGTTIDAGGYAIFDEGDFNPTPLTPGPNDFALSGSHGDSVWLSIANAGLTAAMTIVDAVDFGATLNGVSLGRLPDSSGRLTPLAASSLGSENGSHRVSDVVITEVHYHPELPSPAALAIDPELDRSDLEFIEIHNRADALVDLDRWRIRGDGDYDFLLTAIGAGETILVLPFNPDKPENASRLSAFRTHHGLGTGVRLFGPLSGTLSNSYGRVRLQLPDEAPVDEPTVMPMVLVDEVVYDDLPAWQTAADGQGSSLQRVSTRLLGNLPTTWRADPPTPGSVAFEPRIESIIVNGGDATRSELTQVDVVFDTAVNLAPSVFTLTNVDDNTEVTSLQTSLSLQNGNTVATLTFAPGPSVISRLTGGNTLDDGTYELHLLGSGITAQAGGLSMSEDVRFGADAADAFFRKFGDQNGDNVINLFDFAQFRSAFGYWPAHPSYQSDFDSDGNDIINLFDFAAFRANFSS